MNAKDLLTRFESVKPSEKETYLRIKDWKASALAGYARRVGLEDEVVNPIKNDSERLVSEIMSFLYDEDWEKVLMKEGVL